MVSKVEVSHAEVEQSCVKKNPKQKSQKIYARPINNVSTSAIGDSCCGSCGVI